jgi:hypothetical protein
MFSFLDVDSEEPLVQVSVFYVTWPWFPLSYQGYMSSVILMVGSGMMFLAGLAKLHETLEMIIFPAGIQ